MDGPRALPRGVACAPRFFCFCDTGQGERPDRSPGAPSRWTGPAPCPVTWRSSQMYICFMYIFSCMYIYVCIGATRRGERLKGRRGRRPKGRAPRPASWLGILPYININFCFLLSFPSAFLFFSTSLYFLNLLFKVFNLDFLVGTGTFQGKNEHSLIIFKCFLNYLSVSHLSCLKSVSQSSTRVNIQISFLSKFILFCQRLCEKFLKYRKALVR